MFQRILYAALLPTVVSVGVVLLMALVAKRGRRARRLAAWAVPISAAAGVALAYYQPLHAIADPGVLRDYTIEPWKSDPWQWLLFAFAACCLLWPIAVMPWPRERGRRWFIAGWVALLLGVGGGVLIGLARLDSQPTWYVWIGPLAGLFAALAMYPAAVAEPPMVGSPEEEGAPLPIITIGHRGASDLLAVGLAGVIALPVIALTTEFHSLAILTAPFAFAALAAGVIALLLRDEKYALFRDGLSAGGLVVPIAVALACAMAFIYVPDPAPVHMTVLALAALAGVAAVWTSRLPRVAAVVAALAVAGLGAILLLGVIDLSAYDPDLAQRIEDFDFWGTAVEPEPTNDADLAYWGGGESTDAE